ncbi:hypothetical protein F4821DRAFT_249976 [Hypoxylon rubiginosum]|uniref:Uncharacterized protein n=1 Tax=Hypoxylon rubiginosum TaxID=110542 RepID=A0ACC0CL07_9PEZI|nr:hypothetical protein F4821DRAFT_249976 [Hypoxylon rubiginosum]
MAVKAIVTSCINCISQRKWDQLPTFFAANANWWINGNPARMPMAGDGAVSDRLPMLPGLLGRFDTYSFDIKHIVAEGDRAVVEATATGHGPLDLVYVNNIMMSFELDRNGKITTLREYPDFNELNWVLRWFNEHETTTSTRL